MPPPTPRRLLPGSWPGPPAPATTDRAEHRCSEVRTSPSALQSLLLAMVSPASELTPEAPAEFPLPQQSVQSAPINALKSDLNNSERRAPSSALRFPPAGDHGHSWPTMDNTILSADKVMRVADDAMRATDASATSNVATQTPLNVGPQSPLYCLWIALERGGATLRTKCQAGAITTRDNWTFSLRSSPWRDV